MPRCRQIPHFSSDYCFTSNSEPPSATGGCGSHALTRLLEHGSVDVVAIVRNPDRLPASAKVHPRLAVVTSPEGHLEMDLTEHLRGCDAVVG